MERLTVSRRIALVASAALVGLAACSGGPTTVETPGGFTVELVDPEHLTTCTTLPYAPFQFQDGDTIVGFDVDIVDLVADRLGLPQKIVDIRFDSIKSGAALSGGSCDLAAAGMTITPERSQYLTFSDPYFDEVLAFMVPKGTDVETIDDVVDQGLTLGVQAATTSLDHATEQGLDPEQYEGAAKELQALQSGTVDVVLQDLPVINQWLDDDTVAAEFELGGIVRTGAQYGIGLRKDADPTLVDLVNEVLADAHADGSYDDIHRRWFGTEPPT